LFEKALNLRKSGNLNSAAKLFDLSAKYAIAQKSLSIQFQCLLFETQTFIDLEQVEKANLITIALSKLTNKSMIRPEQLANYHYYRGQVLFLKNNYKEALKEYLLSESIKENIA